MIASLKQFSIDFLDFIFPPICPVCRERLQAEDEIICAGCRGELRMLKRHLCERCGSYSAVGLCARCKSGWLFLERARSLCAFATISRGMIHNLKFDGRVELARPMARLMYLTWHDELAGRVYDLLMPVPLHQARRRERGFNQAELLARELTAITSMRLETAALRRTRATPAQTSLSQQSRWKNVRGAFSVARPEVIRERHILLIDDVATTLATGNACAEALHRHGAASVSLLTFARA